MNSKIILRLGAVEISEGILSLHAIDPLNNYGRAEVLLAASALEELRVDYMAWATLTLSDGKDWNELVFGGMVDTVELQGSRVRLTFVGQMAELAEILQGPIDGFRVPPLEQIWSTLRMAGMDEERIQIAGFAKGLLEPFTVACPVPNLIVNGNVQIDSVRLTSDSPAMRALADRLGPSEPHTQYMEAQAWAVTTIWAQMLFDAESLGLGQITRALAWATVQTQYSYSHLPSDEPQPFERSWVLGCVTRGDAVLVRAHTTDRRWVRIALTKPIRPIITLDAPLRFKQTVDLGDLTVQELEAMAFWSQATQTDDRLARVTLLTNALEFFAAGRKPPKRFTKSELRGIRTRADEALTEAEEELLSIGVEKMQEGLTQEQRDRIRHVKDNLISQLNEPSFMARLRQAIGESGMPISADELEVLTRVRKWRNDLVHGRAVAEPDRYDLQYAATLVNRMLMYRKQALQPKADETL